MKHTVKAWVVKLRKSGAWGLGFDGPFPTRKKARECLRKGRTDGWEGLRVARIVVTIEEIPSSQRPLTCAKCGIHLADYPSDLCLGCEAYGERHA